MSENQSNSMHTNYSVGTKDIASSLMPCISRNCKSEALEIFTFWPPDLFCLTSRILSLTGSYVHILNPPKDKNWPPVRHWDFKEKESQENETKKPGDWIDYVRGVAEKWKDNLESVNLTLDNLKIISDGSTPTNFPKLPDELTNEWELFVKTINTDDKGDAQDFRKILDENGICTNEGLWDSFEALMTLHAIADATCSGWGIHLVDESKYPNTYNLAKKLLSANGTLSTIHPNRGRIFPKRHTPSVGITLRSTSANLAHHHSSVNVNWRLLDGNNYPHVERLPKFFSKLEKEGKSKLRILLLPYPQKVYAKDFKETKGIQYKEANCRFFEYAPADNTQKFKSYLEQTIKKAKEETDEIDMVILPELSISEAEIITLEKVLSVKNIPLYICGVRKSSEKNKDENQRSYGSNRLRINYIDENNKYTDENNECKEEKNKFTDENKIIQNKHHRWKLDENQLKKYNLGSSLDINSKWWEGINMPPRTVNFINVGSAFTFCALICEDLARQDPIADLLRTVGPNLVIATLMDGPQVSQRWSAKYASVLSEDPGSTVITLTSLGMAKRAAKGNEKLSIALVSDGKGNKTEINIAQNSLGALITLNLTTLRASLADGRKDRGRTNRLIFAGVHEVKE